MKIIALSSDKSVLEPNSKTAARIAEYKKLVDEYIVLVPKSRSKIGGFFSLFSDAKKTIREKKIDIITSQDPYFIGLIAVLLGKKFHIGVEIQIHGWEKFSFLRRKLACFVLWQANSIRVVSPRIKKKLVNDFKIKEGKITVVPVYVDVSEKNADRIPGQDSHIVFLTVGRLVSVKNICLQVKAMEEIVKTDPSVELWIVGDGPERKSLESEIKRCWMEKNIKLLGWQDPSQYYASADVFLLTSDQEGWGLVVIEAASYGLPIIMTDVGSAGDFIVNNESGIVIPVGDKVKLVEAMRNMINNKELRVKLSHSVKEALKRLPTKEENLKLYQESWQKASLS